MPFINGINSSKKYTWKVDLPDHRDYLYNSSVQIATPDIVDLRSFSSDVENQSTLGSCTGNSLVSSVEYIHRNYFNDTTDYSRLFLYYNERVAEGTVKEDSGAMIRTGVKSLAKEGICPEKSWPYVIEKFKRKPTKACYKKALKNVISTYYRLMTLDDMIHCLASGYPFVFGFAVYSGFESAEVARTGIVNYPQPNEEFLGGHAVQAVGYNKNTKRFIVRNSWGKDWGDKGYFTIPFDYVTDPNLADDFWTIRK